MSKRVKILLVVILIPVIAASAIAAYLSYALPNVGPAPKLSVEPLPESIERGKYLVNSVAACMVCHTKRDFSSWGGPVDSSLFGAGGERFDKSMVSGTLYTTNITPFALQDWTDGEIFRAITTGVKKDGSAMHPIMPYKRYGKMDTRDAYAMVAYLRTLKPVEREVPPAAKLDFPLNFTVNTHPAKAEPVQRPDPANTVEYGKYLVNIANCEQCHSQTDKINIKPGTEFGGGQAYLLRAGAAYSANITPDMETGIGKWTKEYFIRRFKQYSDTSYVPVKPVGAEFNSPMPWLAFSYMTENDLAAIYDYLRTVKPLTHKVEKWVPEK